MEKSSEKSNLFMVIIIALLVILLGAVAFVAVFVLKLTGGEGGEQPQMREALTKLTVEQIEKSPLSSPISTNLMGGHDGMEHYVKINLSVGVNNTDKKESPKLLETLTKNEMVTRDIVLGVLRSQTYEELTIPEGQDLLKEQIKSRLQEEYDTNLIIQVYISDLAFS